MEKLFINFKNDLIINIFLIIFIVYIPSFAFALFHRLKSNDIKEKSISSLAKDKYPYNIAFNLGVSIYGLLSIFSIIKFYKSFQSDYSLLMSVLYIIISLSTILVGVFPVSKSSFKHKVVAIILFASLLVLEALFSFAFLSFPGFTIVSAFSAVLLFFTILLVLNANRKLESRVFFKYECAVLMGTFFWNMIFSFCMLI